MNGPILSALDWLDRVLHRMDCAVSPDPGDAGVLVCTFRGTLGNGSSGNGQVHRMDRAIRDALCFGHQFRALVLDLSAVKYTFGDHIIHLIWRLTKEDLDLALVISPLCEQLGDFAGMQYKGRWHVCRSREEAIAKLSGLRGEREGAATQ